jgi:hypothetical protein
MPILGQQARLGNEENHQQPQASSSSPAANPSLGWQSLLRVAGRGTAGASSALSRWQQHAPWPVARARQAPPPSCPAPHLPRANLCRRQIGLPSGTAPRGSPAPLDVGADDKYQDLALGHDRCALPYKQ